MSIQPFKIAITPFVRLRFQDIMQEGQNRSSFLKHDKNCRASMWYHVPSNQSVLTDLESLVVPGHLST
jgi:hypothetical protein